MPILGFERMVTLHGITIALLEQLQAAGELGILLVVEIIRHDLREALLDLRYHLRRLQWYGEVNRRGFVKITKKLDKKVGPRIDSILRLEDAFIGGERSGVDLSL
jgi:SPX domain protein involved in polyphosphate accumulation